MQRCKKGSEKRLLDAAQVRPVDELLALVQFCPMLEYDDHNNILLK